MQDALVFLCFYPSQNCFSLAYHSGIGWLFAFMVGTVPAVLMNIFEEFEEILFEERP